MVFSMDVDGEERLVKYPETARGDHTDVYHGEVLSSPGGRARRK